MPLLLLGLLAVSAAPAPLERLFAELDVGLAGRAATAVAVSPEADRILLVAVDGMLFRSTDTGRTFDLVHRPGTAPTAEQEERAEDLAEEEAEDNTGAGASAEDFQPDLDAADTATALEDLEDDLQQRLEADRAEETLPDGDDTAAARTHLPLMQELPGIRRVLFATASVVFMATQKGLFRSVDGGQTFEVLSLPSQGRSRDVRDVAVAPNVPTFIVAVTAGGTLQSRDGGLTWLPAPGVAGRAAGLSCAVGPGASPVVAVGTRLGLLRSLDAGRTYDPLLLPGEGANRAVISVAVDGVQERLYALSPNVLYAGPARSKVLAPTGAGWRNALLTVHTEPDRPNVLFAGGRTGAFISLDGGKTAVELGQEAMVRDVVNMSVSRQDRGMVVVATAGGALAWLPLVRVPGGLTSVQLFQLLVSQEPTESETAGWATEHHRADPAHTTSMGRRVRLAALAPRVSVLSGATAGNPYFITDNSVGATPVTQNWHLQGSILGVLSWRGDYLLSRPYEVVTSREHSRMLKERDRVWRKVLRAYEQRRRLQAIMIASPSRSASALSHRRLQLDQLTAVLDGMTGGRFTLEARRRGAPGDGVSVRLP
jgi:hypothetical protein